MSEPDRWTVPGGGPGQPPSGTAAGAGPEPAGDQSGDPAPAPSPGGWGAPPGWTAQGALAPLRPGIVPLRPLGLGELYDGAFQAVRSNPGAVLGSSAVVALVVTVVTTLVQGTLLRGLTRFTADVSSGRAVTPDDVVGPLTGFLVGTSVSSLVTQVAVAVLAGAVTVAVSTAVLGRRTAAGALWRRVRGRAVALVGLSLLVTLVTTLAFLVALAPGAVLVGVGAASRSGATAAGGVVLTLLGLLLAVVVFAFLDVRLFLAPPALVLEHQRVLAALRRAWALSRHGFWRLLGTRWLALIIVGVAGQVVIQPFAYLGQAVSAAAGGDGELGRLLGSAVGQLLALTVLYPLTAAVTALQYVDQRMRREGLDVELARAATEPG